LSQQVFDVTPFTGPLEALEATQTETPNLLIADVMMPGSSGIELAIALREACPACAVILFSGQPSTETMLETARIRGHDFQVLAKPVHPIEILARIRSALKLDASDDESKASLQS
jgi:DNA-binding response OmpR family regulator